MFWASFFDPGDNGLDFTDVAGLLTLAIVIAGIVGGAMRWYGKRVQKKADELEARIVTLILETTRPIQPGYRNGGESLADVAETTRTLQTNQADIRDDVKAMRDLLFAHVADTDLHRSANA